MSQTTQDVLRIGELKEEVRTLRSEREKLFGRVEGLAGENERLRAELFVFRRVLEEPQRRGRAEDADERWNRPLPVEGYSGYGATLGNREDLADIARMRNRETVSLVERISSEGAPFRRNHELANNIGDSREQARKNGPKFDIASNGNFVASDSNLQATQARYISPPRTSSANFQASNILTWGNAYNSRY